MPSGHRAIWGSFSSSLKWPAAIATAFHFAVAPAHAVDEIQVYNAEIAEPGQFTLFGVVDFKAFGRDVDLGMGVGLTGASDSLVTKMILGKAF